MAWLGIAFVQQAMTLLWVEVPGMDDYNMPSVCYVPLGHLMGVITAAAIFKCRCRHKQLLKQRLYRCSLYFDQKEWFPWSLCESVYALCLRAGDRCQTDCNQLINTVY